MRRKALAAAFVLTTFAACSGDASDPTTGSTATATSTPGPSVPDISLVPATTGPTVPPPSVDLPDELPTELVVTELEPGCGVKAADGDAVFVNYVGVRSEDGTQFDSNFGDQPFPVQLGAGGVIAGWDQGLVGVSAGERVQLDIPSELAYGDAPEGDVIKAGDALTFVIDVVGVVPTTDPADAPSDVELPTSDEPVSDLVTDDVREGDCTAIAAGMTGIIHLQAARADTGAVFGSTWDTAQPETIVLEEAQLLPGLVDGIVGMQVGGRRIITIPSDRAFGPEGRPELDVPPDTAVIVIVDLLAAF
ncbi:MAG: FKBP-type peptidyl-prolyl cis-trans isomerase [Acidimicrobiia bacterium]|nr:FKBP-type peptidyl-prolyl cis-trans isomerase [Acidimicrobiia bacterium]